MVAWTMPIRTSFPSGRSRRGFDQCGTLGSGNHFMEVQVVDEIADADAAAAFGLAAGQIALMIHSGSRGLGYQVCEDSLQFLRDTPRKYGIDLPDRQLACAPVSTHRRDSGISVRCGRRRTTRGQIGR